MIVQALKKLDRWRRSVGLQRPPTLDPRIRAFIDWNRAKWSQRPADESKGVVLVGYSAWNPSIFCYGYAANFLAAPHGGAVRAFSFHEGLEKTAVRPLFASFGAALGLSFAQSKPHRALAARQADEIFRALRSKTDVVRIAVDGVPLGDLIYDTYLRYLPAATVDLADPGLRATIFETLLIYHACREYLATHKILAVIPDHTVYSQCGVLIRLALRAKIPVIFVPYNPRFLLNQIDHPMRPGESPVCLRWPYPRFREFFATLTPEQQERARTRARTALTERLAGKVDHAILVQVSAYNQTSATPLMRPSARPRVLVLLHDFCDGVHGYRDMLFDDCYEWLNHLLSRASETPFDWYVKPHPNISLPSREAMNETNRRALADFRARFPQMTFLDAKVSNKQLVSEGVSAMFTIHGTAAHEFAYMGVPVVNAGDNPHIAYDFNLHARTIEEYDTLIRRADALEVKIEKADVEEFFYMNYFFFHETQGCAQHLIDIDRVSLSDLDAKGTSADLFEIFMQGITPEREAAVRDYVQAFVRTGGTSGVLAGK